MAIPHRARRLASALRAEQRTLRQGFAALLISTLAAFVAGVTLGSITGTLEALPGLIILIPAAVATRGTIFGAIGARLGTSTHAGLFRVSWERSGVLYQNVFVGIVLTLGSSLFLAVLAKLSAATFNLPSISVLDLITISVVGGTLGSAMILALTIGLAILSFRRGYDLDAVATPVITATGDMVTIPALFAATFILQVEWLNGVVSGVAIAGCLYAVIRGALTDLPAARRVMGEALPVMLVTPVFSILAGTVVQARLDRFVALPGLLVLVPPLISNAGALGGIFSSRLSSKLHLGVIGPRGRPDAPAVADAGLVLAMGVVAFSVTGALGYGFSDLIGKAHPGLGTMIGGTLVSGFVASIAAVIVGYYVAIATTRFGLDPDNHSVPVITSVMDLLGVVTFLFVLSLFGVAHG